ncbi:MAG: hypothetical protein HQ551_10575 [Desulfobacteraceae bacterium]|nr:hypothetical protein [Desulfobacteraceae bacterium]
MKLFNENTVNPAKEKHVAVIEKIADGLKVKAGSVAYFMKEQHFAAE